VLSHDFSSGVVENWGRYQSEARRAESRGPKLRERCGVRVGWGLGGVGQPSPHQLRSLGECCKRPERRPDRAPAAQRFLVFYGRQMTFRGMSKARGLILDIIVENELVQ